MYVFTHETLTQHTRHLAHPTGTFTSHHTGLGTMNRSVLCDSVLSGDQAACPLRELLVDQGGTVHGLTPRDLLATALGSSCPGEQTRGFSTSTHASHWTL